MERAEINGETKIFGLIGWPVTHTFSPAMHNAAFKARSINAIYVPLAVEEKNLKSALKGLIALGFGAVNVTIPYKEKVIPYLSKVELSASLVGAVNTIVVKEGKLIGYNTDWVGFIASLKKDAKFDPLDKKALLLGAGGAARAVAVALASCGIRHLWITDCVKAKAQKLALHINKQFKKTKAEFIPSLKSKKGRDKLKESDLVINATGIGMHKKDPALIESEWVRKGQLAYDLIYNPPVTNFLKVYKDKGAKILNGEGLLLYQGAEAFRLFTSISAPVGVMRRALRKQIASRVG